MSFGSVAHKGRKLVAKKGNGKRNREDCAARNCFLQIKGMSPLSSFTRTKFGTFFNEVQNFCIEKESVGCCLFMLCQPVFNKSFGEQGFQQFEYAIRL
jgi:hypothetical protein